MAFSLYDVLLNHLCIDEEARQVQVTKPLTASNYNKVKSVLSRLGGSWSTSSQSFHFAKSPGALIERVLECGAARLNRFHFYPTPDPVFDYMVQHTPLNYMGAAGPIRILEPSCGEGGLIRRLTQFAEKEGRGFDIEGYDIDPLNVTFCQEAGYRVKEVDFLTVTPTADYDLVVINPPFNGSEFIRHILHAQRFLKVNGKMVCVIPANWLENAKKMQDALYVALLEQIQISDCSDLETGNLFAPGTFSRVGIPTAVVTLVDKHSADATLASDRYAQQAVAGFGFYTQMDATYPALQKSVASTTSSKEAHALVAEYVDRVLNTYQDETLHLVRRYRDEYVAHIVEEEFHDAMTIHDISWLEALFPKDTGSLAFA